MTCRDIPMACGLRLLAAFTLAAFLSGCAQTEHFWDTHIDPLGYEDQHDPAMSDAVAKSKKDNTWFSDWFAADTLAKASHMDEQTDESMPITRPTRSSKTKAAITDSSPSAITNFALFGIASQTPAQTASSKPIPITFAKSGSDFDPAIDPTGRWLVFASTRDQAQPKLYLKALEDAAATPLTRQQGSDVMPAFSPDGRIIAFASDRNGGWDLFLLTLETGHVTALTQSRSDVLHPSFSPDGRQLVFCTRGSPSDAWHLVMIDLASPMTWRLLGEGLFPQWSPDGGSIVYQRPCVSDPSRFEIWLIDLEGDQAKSPRALASGENATLIHPCFSSDGQRIAFVAVMGPDADARSDSTVSRAMKTQSPAPHSQIWTMNRQGGERQRVSDGRAMDVQPCWSHHGSLFVASNRMEQPSGGLERIWRLSP